MLRSEVAQSADFSEVRYGQCWEDADILLEGLSIQPGHTCLSIASAGDNTLALLSKKPRKVFAIDLSPPQLAELELRVAAFRGLTHAEMLALIGSVPSARRMALYGRCRQHLSAAATSYWDRRPKLIELGVGSAGQFERYLGIFRRFVLPLIQSRDRVEHLLASRPEPERLSFYDNVWNNLRWRLLFRLFFSRRVMQTMGRDREFFRYVDGEVALKLLHRTRYAMVKLDPAVNPYLHWMLTGQHGDALPFALRAENFNVIRGHLDRLEWRCCSLEEFLQESTWKFDAFNLSDVFEYMSEENYFRLLHLLVRVANPHARLAYWNLFVPRRAPKHLAGSLRSMKALSTSLSARDKAFVYSSFQLEEVMCSAEADTSTDRAQKPEGASVIE
jgi:S-adenosylmethionine-diacylglycerol 3-amino-3-carboxypropyl transferase